MEHRYRCKYCHKEIAVTDSNEGIHHCRFLSHSIAIGDVREIIPAADDAETFIPEPSRPVPWSYEDFLGRFHYLGELTSHAVMQEVYNWFTEGKLNNNENIGEFSDGYHTFNELYDQRSLLFANLCSIARDAWKSRHHSDSTHWEGWFIAGIGKEPGKQITFHVPEKYWDEFECESLQLAPEFDGHTSQDVIRRLKIQPPTRLIEGAAA